MIPHGPFLMAVSLRSVCPDRKVGSNPFVWKYRKITEVTMHVRTSVEQVPSRKNFRQSPIFLAANMRAQCIPIERKLASDMPRQSVSTNSIRGLIFSLEPCNSERSCLSDGAATVQLGPFDD